MRTIPLVVFLVCSGALLGNEIAGDWANPPLAIVAEKVELTVGRELTMVAGQYTFQYVEKDDVGHLSRIFIHYPLYVESGLREWRDVATASDIKLQIGNRTYLPTAGGIVGNDYLSDFPIPEDAAVAFLTFEIPREAATWRFEATITHIQPNFHYRGALLAAYTPWLPKVIQMTKAYDFTDQDLEVVLRGVQGVAFKRYTANKVVVKESPSELAVVPEHRTTIAVQILPDQPPKPTEPGKSGAGKAGEKP